jgi:mannose-6-phosphate isomerase-like protein (cupin superfamily)
VIARVHAQDASGLVLKSSHTAAVECSLDSGSAIYETPQDRAIASRRQAPEEETMSHESWKFSHSQASEATWTPGLREIFEYRDLGFKDATTGDYVAHVIRHNGKKSKDEVQKWHVHDCTFQMVYVLNGWAKFEYAGEGVRTIKKGDCINQRPGIPHREIACSEDFEVLEVVSPANFATRVVEGPDGKLQAAE